MAKKRLSIFIDSDTEKIMNVIKEEIDEGQLGFIQNQSHFFEMLILNFAYQILTDTDTFLKEPKELKKRLNAIELNKFTFADVQSELGNKQLQVVEEYQTLLKEKEYLDEELDDKTDEIEKLKRKIGDLEEREEYLKKRVNDVSMNMPARNTHQSNVDETVDTSINKNRTSDRKEHKFKAHYPKAHVIQLMDGDKRLTDVNVQTFTEYLKENRNSSFIDSLKYIDEEDKELMIITPRVLMEFGNMAREFDSHLQLVETSKDYQDKMKESETLREGFTVMTLHTKENERMKRLRERRLAKEQQRAKEEQERLERTAKHDKKKKAKKENKPESVIEREERKRQQYDEQQYDEQQYDEQQYDEQQYDEQDENEVSIKIEDGLYRLYVIFTVGENKYRIRDDDDEIEDSEVTVNFVEQLLDLINDTVISEEGLEEGQVLKHIFKKELPMFRDEIITSWRNDRVPKIVLEE